MLDKNIENAILKLAEDGKTIKQIQKYLKKKHIDISIKEIEDILKSSKYDITEYLKDLPVREELINSIELELDLHKAKIENIAIQLLLVRVLSKKVFTTNPNQKGFTRYARLLNEANLGLNKMLENVQLDDEDIQQIEFNFEIVQERKDINED